MWISRIALRNFKSYRNQVFEFPRPADGKNLVLVGGVNGYGKTHTIPHNSRCMIRAHRLNAPDEAADSGKALPERLDARLAVALAG